MSEFGGQDTPIAIPDTDLEIPSSMLRKDENDV